MRYQTLSPITGRQPLTRDAKAYLTVEETRNLNIPVGEFHPFSSARRSTYTTSVDEILESSADAVTDDRIREFLVAEGTGILGLTDGDVPYMVPMSFGFDGESALYFVFLLFGSESHKETLCDRERRARFLVYRADSMHEWRSVSLTGDIAPVEDDEWGALQDAMENAWHPDLFSGASPMRGIEGYRLRVDDWTGIEHT